MANQPTQPEPAVPNTFDLRNRLRTSTPETPPHPAELPDPETAESVEFEPNPGWAAGESFRSEMERYAAQPGKKTPAPDIEQFPDVEELRARLQGARPPARPPEVPATPTPPRGYGLPPLGRPNTSVAPAQPAPNGYGEAASLFRGEPPQTLEAENAELRWVLEDMKQLISEAAQQEQAFLAKQAQLESQLAEKTKQCDLLQEQMQEIEQQLAATPGLGAAQPAPAPVPRNQDELETMADELEKERCQLAVERRQLDEDRRQMREDEKALEQQMRTMELEMARQRASVARQEMQLRQLNEDIDRKLGLMQRGDGRLKEQLSQLQRRQQEANLPQSPPGAPPAPAAPPPAAGGANGTGRDSGVIRRFFGSK
jgi:hypothetical protein